MRYTSKREIKARMRFYPFWVHLGKSLFDPIIFAFAIILFFTHIQEFIYMSSSFSDFWQLLTEDNSMIYIIFGVLFVIWIIYRLKLTDREFKEREADRRMHLEMLKLLRQIAKYHAKNENKNVT